MGLEIDTSSIVITDRNGNEKFSSNDKLTYLLHTYEHTDLTFSTSSPTTNLWIFSSSYMPDINDNAFVVPEITITSITGISNLESLVGDSIPLNGVIPLSLDVTGALAHSTVIVESRMSFISCQRQRTSTGENQLILAMGYVDPFGQVINRVLHDTVFDFRYNIYAYQ